MNWYFVALSIVLGALIASGYLRLMRRQRTLGIYDWLSATALVFAAVFFIAGGKYARDHAPPKIEDVVSSDTAQKFLIGTWTYTEPLNQENYIVQWEKWVIRPGGMVDIYSARPSDDDWGQPRQQPYEMITGKYNDTGKRFYGIRIKDQVVRAIILDNDLLAFTISDSRPVPMRRGDKNPFSK